MAEQLPSNDGVAAVDRALAIAMALERARTPLSLAELSRVTDLYKSTLLRLLISLERAALVIRRTDGRYVLGPMAARLGRAFDETHQLREHIVPVLEQLVNEGTESSSFHVKYDDELRLCLFRVNSHHSTLDSVHEGDLLPLQSGAAAKALLHYERSDRAPHEEKDHPPIFSSFGERDPSCAAIACPVWGVGGQLLGALSLSGPKERFTEESVERMSNLLQKKCKALTLALGGTWPEA